VARALLLSLVVILLIALIAVAGLGAAADNASHDSQLSRLSTQDKVGQLFMLGFDGGNASAAEPALAELRAGGIALLSNARSATAARELTTSLQSLAQARGLVPPIIAVDHEGGLVQRIRQGATVFGPAFEIGQIQPLEAAIAEAARRGDLHGRELGGMGISMSLGPVLDVWDNPANEVIGRRAFSRSADVAAALGSAYITALQAHGVLAVGKHFPGHGNSLEDSHQTLPTVWRNRAMIDSIELLPFHSAIQANVAGVMTAHVSYPLVDTVAERPASLSPRIVTGMLRNDLGFSGLALTDDMGAMEAITGRFEAGEAAIQAIEAGSDMLIVVGPLSRQRRMVEAVLGEVGRRISLERLDDSVRRVMEAKRRAELVAP
jgi:beta-N-acetylhexosaminidase